MIDGLDSYKATKRLSGQLGRGLGHGITCLARDHVYVLPDDRKLVEEYYRASVLIVDQQLAKAGVRLTRILSKGSGRK